MDIRTTTLDGAAEAQGTVVVVDVLRAFTTAALALARGATSVRCVRRVSEARALREQLPGSLALGEVDGRPIEGFDLSNSPSGVLAADVGGRALVHRSTAGTQGVALAASPDRPVYAASFACAGATARCVAAARPDVVTFVLTGVDARDGDEDRACAEYIAALLDGASPPPETYLARIATSDAGRRFGSGDPDFPAADLEVAAWVDAVGFALRAGLQDGVPTLVPERPVGLELEEGAPSHLHGHTRVLLWPDGALLGAHSRSLPGGAAPRRTWTRAARIDPELARALIADAASWAPGVGPDQLPVPDELETRWCVTPTPGRPVTFSRFAGSVRRDELLGPVWRALDRALRDASGGAAYL
jgi:2-phosphosulfolactate phosphatase